MVEGQEARDAWTSTSCLSEEYQREDKELAIILLTASSLGYASVKDSEHIGMVGIFVGLS